MLGRQCGQLAVERVTAADMLPVMEAALAQLPQAEERGPAGIDDDASETSERGDEPS